MWWLDRYSYCGAQKGILYTTYKNLGGWLDEVGPDHVICFRNSEKLFEEKYNGEK